MGRKSKKSAAVNIDALVAEAGKPVDASEIVSLADETTPIATVKEVEGAKVVVAHTVNGVEAELPSLHLKPEDVFVEFDARTVPNLNQHAVDIDFAINIFLYGQKQPAIVYQDPVDNRYLIITGRTRRRAIKLLNEGFDAVDPRTGETSRFHLPDLKLWVAVDRPRSKEDLFVGDLVTQIKSNPLTAVQEAYAVKKLTETWGWTLTDAAKLFGYDNTNRAAKLLKLLTLEEAVIEKVHANDLSLDAAVATADLTQEQRLSIISRAEKSDGKVDGGLIRELLRDVYSQGDEEVKKATGRSTEGEGDEGDEKGGAKKKSAPAGVNLNRNVAKFKVFAEGIISDSESEFGEPAKKLLGRLLEWFSGEKGDTSLKNALREYVNKK
jgi:ParB-like chromosome segregation protein Spo0J